VRFAVVFKKMNGKLTMKVIFNKIVVVCY